MTLQDPNSQANINDVRTTHMHIEWKVEFAAKQLQGNVILDFEVTRETSRVVLDTNHLAIENAEVRSSSGDVWSQAPFSMGQLHEKFGSPLVIDLPRAAPAGSKVQVRVTYHTTPEGMATQWLAPEQTTGKKHPYLFTQCQAIHARSLVPCQDSPSMKAPYTASVSAPQPLIALMSALRDGNSKEGEWTTYKFKQPVAIPSYLIALAVGHLRGVDVGPRSTVWSEGEMADIGAKEFADTEKFIATAESLLSPYCWGRYDMLILPGSFPFGGMENTCLTSLTPTIVAGDKSLVDVVAHEISHSWSGNLVTTQNWEHFWLNEGFCVFIERKIAQRLHGEQTRQFMSIIGWKALEESIEVFGSDNPLTCLCPKLNDIDPDDAFSSVPYEKGYNLLYYLEQLLGGPSVFEPYVKAHFDHFAHKTLITDDWKKYLYEYFGKQHPDKVALLDKVDWNAWLYAPGMPPTKMPFDKSMANACHELANRWNTLRQQLEKATSTFKSDDIAKFSTGQKIVFLEAFLDKDPLPHALLKAMDSVYNFSSVTNSEIRFRWQQICLKAEYEEIFPQVVKFVTEQGRMKFIRPLYRALNKCKNGSTLAKETFKKLRAGYHPIAAQLVAKDILKE